MEIIFLGSGNLGNYLNNYFSKINQVKILPLNSTSISAFKNEILNFSSQTIFLDLMDPNKIDQFTNYKLLDKASEIRTLISQSSYVNHYIYLSTANLYNASLNNTFENSKLKEDNLSEYLALKKASEKILTDLGLPLSICRIPNIWGHNASHSFFNDLFNSFNNNSFIKYRKGDEKIISYINIHDLCKLLIEVFKEKIFGVINLSTDSFNSRYNLKAKVNKDKVKSIDNSKGIRLTSKNLIWSKYIKKLELPF